MKNKGLPNLARYVASRANTSMDVTTVASGCLIAAMASGLAGVGLARVLSVGVAFGLSVLVLLPLFTMLAMLWVTAIQKPKTDDEVRQREAQEAITFMNGAAVQGKLHRKLDRAPALLLEECARHWVRVQDALSGGFWEDKDLPGHWKAIRESSLAAANRAMEDIILMLRPVLEARNQTSEVPEFIGDLLSSFFDVHVETPIEPLPAAFLPARDIAQKLKSLADEVELAAQKAMRDQAFSDHYASPTQIDEVLAGLREIRQAESELHQEVGGNDRGAH